MAKNIHVIKDESLGGVKREYIEVDRKANVGDINHAGHSEYKTLEPTDIVHIDGERFRMVERKAEVGEKIIVVEEEPSDGDYSNGDILIVDESIEESAWEYEGVLVDDPHHSFLFTKEYRVLVPVESETSPQNTDDIIANLVARVAELERFIAGQRSENQLVYDNIEGVKDDIETWSREIETLKHASKETDDKIEMVIDDIVTLDERTQPKKVSIDADTLVKLIGGVRV